MPESQAAGHVDTPRPGEQAPHTQQDESAAGSRNGDAMGPMRVIMATVLAFGVWILIGLGIAAIFSTTWRTWWSDNWVWVSVASVAVIALFALSEWVEKRLALQTESRRRAILAFLVVPFLTLGVMAVIMLGARGMALALELIVILVAALVPAVTYYLFIVVRRPSLFNEFLSNLSALGLLAPHPVRETVRDSEGNVHTSLGYESTEERNARVEGYLQRFESIFGTLRFDSDDGAPIRRPGFVARLLACIDKKSTDLEMPEVTIRLVDIFRANLVIPVGLVTILTSLGWLLAIQPELIGAQSPLWSGPEAGGGNPGAGNENSAAANLLPAFTPAGFAFLGAYFFGIQMMFRRFVRRDLGPNAYMAFANRILLAWIAIWVVLAISEVVGIAEAQNGKDPGPTDAITQVVTDQWPPVIYGIAFLLGVFPRILWQFLNAVAMKTPVIKFAIPETRQPLTGLDGLTIWHEARLEEEDVENIPNMATVNVVDILLHTQIPAERLVSWIDQAILYSVLGPEPEQDENSRASKLRKLGIRSATQIVDSWSASDSEKAALKEALGENHVETLVRAVQLESNFSVVKAWRDSTKHYTTP